MRKRVGRLVASFLVLAFTSAPLLGQADQTASQFYLAYRAVFDKAKSIDELLPFMSKTRVDQVKATPAGESAMMFEMIKMMGALTNVKVLNETETSTGATLTVEGVDSDNARSQGTITLVKEDGAWKLDKESWSGS